MKMNTAITYMPDETEIQRAAYSLWHQSGQPEGRDKEFWFAAIELLKHHHATPPPVAIERKKPRARPPLRTARV